MLIAMAGLPGTGKSTLARLLAGELGGVVLDKDAIRAALFPPDEVEYSTQQDDFCLSIMLQVAGYLLRKDRRRVVILDGRPFARAYQRTEVIAFAQENGAPWRIVECVCADDTARRRLTRDADREGHVARNRDYGLYLALKAQFEPITQPKLVVDTDQPVEACLALCLAYIKEKPS